jgi:hypothetical protein
MKAPLFALLAALVVLNTVGYGEGAPPGYRLHGWFKTLRTLRPGDPVMRAGTGTPENNPLASPAGAPPVKVQAQFVRGKLQISASVQPLDEQTLRQADQELRAAASFAWGGGLSSGPLYVVVDVWCKTYQTPPARPPSGL